MKTNTHYDHVSLSSS